MRSHAAQTWHSGRVSRLGHTWWAASATASVNLCRHGTQPVPGPASGEAAKAGAGAGAYNRSMMVTLA